MAIINEYFDASDHPDTGPLNAIDELRQHRAWVSWKYVPRQLADGSWSITKPPVDPHTGRGASHSNPATWGTYDEACKRTRNQKLAGVGFVMSEDDDYTGYDLDDCRNAQTGEIEPWAMDILELAETYAEVSPSGEGIRLIARGKVEKTIKCDPAHVEIYRSQRYLTITQDHIEGTPLDIRPAPMTYDMLVGRVEDIAPRPIPLAATSRAVITKANDPVKPASTHMARVEPATELGYFRAVNDKALANIGSWVSSVFPGARAQPGTGAYRISSKQLGRTLQEDLSIAPNGIIDFGIADMGDARQGARTAIDIVMEYRGETNAVDAASWLCGRLGVAPESLGWGAENAAIPKDGATSPRLKPIQWLEPKPLPTALLPVPLFDTAYLPDALATWVGDIAERMQCPLDFVGIPAIVALGSVLGCKIAIRPQRNTTWQEVPNLWGFIVGRPGSMKSPATKEAMKPLDRLEALAFEDNAKKTTEFNTAVLEHKLRKESAERKARKGLDSGDTDLSDFLGLIAPEPPQLRRYIKHDCTYEALGLVLSHNPTGILAYRDELVSLLKSLDREENAAARGFYLTAWNGTDRYTFDRITRGHIQIETACLSLLGSTQPGKLVEMMRRASGSGDDGMVQRFGLMVWPDAKPAWENIDRPIDSRAREIAWRVFDTLNALVPPAVGAEMDDSGGIPYLHFSPVAQDIFDEWRVDFEKEMRSTTLSPALESHRAKYRKLVPTLALINHLADGGQGPVNKPALLRSLAFTENYLQHHAKRCYAAGTEAEITSAKAILSRIKKGDIADGFTARDVHQRAWSNLTNIDHIKIGLELLVELDWLAQKDERTGGRPRISYLINPRGTK